MDGCKWLSADILLADLLISALAYMIYSILLRSKRKRFQDRFVSNPEWLGFILQYMIYTLKKEGDWEKLE